MIETQKPGAANRVLWLSTCAFTLLFNVWLMLGVLGILPLFAALMFVLGCAMGIGKASVYKYIPDYFPEDVGAAGGVVGALGALGGFILPPAFGLLGRWSGIPQLAFTALLTLTLWSLAWLHFTVVRARNVGETSRWLRGLRGLKSA